MLIRVILSLLFALLLPHSNFPHLGYYPLILIIIDRWESFYFMEDFYVFLTHYLIYGVLLFGLSFLLPKRIFGSKSMDRL